VGLILDTAPLFELLGGMRFVPYSTPSDIRRFTVRLL
jgi:hypothetical protein